MLLRGFIFVSLSALSVRSLHAQYDLKFASTGRLSDISPNRVGVLRNISPISTDVNNEAKRRLKEKFRKTADRLDRSSAAYPFYREVWGEDGTRTLRQSLLELSRTFTTRDAMYTELITALPELDKPTLILSQGRRLRIEGDLTRINVFNRFLIDYYNKTLDGSLDVKNKTDGEYLDMSQFLISSYAMVCSSLRAARLSLKEKNRILLENADAYKAESDYYDIKTFLTKPWFRQWIWYTDGVARLNPLQNATGDFLEKNPQYDIVNAGLLNQFVEALINKNLQSPDAKNLQEFKDLLKLRQNGYREFLMGDRNGAIIKENQLTIEDLTNVTQVLNNVAFPLKLGDVSPMLYYTADKSFKGQRDITDIKGQVEGQQKTIVVFNVPEKTDIYIREATKPYADIPPFREFTNDLAANLPGLLSVLLKGGKQVGDVFASLQNVQRAVPARSNTPQMLYVNEFSSRSFKSLSPPKKQKKTSQILTKYLVDEGIFNQHIYDSLQDDNSFSDLLKTIAARGDSAFQEAVKQYEVSYRDYYDAFVRSSEADSLVLSHFINAIVNSTLPFPDLKEAKPKPALYSTSIKSTTAYDKAVTNEVRIVAMTDKKDSAVIEQFSYNVGKRHWYQLSAGIAASFPSPVVNEATQNAESVTLAQKRQQVKLIAGINIYPLKGLYLQDTRVRFTPDRYSFFAGVGFPNPIKNIYTGASWDIIPSVKIMGGVHWFNLTTFEIKNDRIANENKKYNAYPFASIAIDPVSFISVLNLFLK
jgi:hypothetical protein